MTAKYFRQLCSTLVLALLLLPAGCITASNVSTANNLPGVQLISADQYAVLLDKQSRYDRLYDGVIELIELHATLVNAELAKAQTDQNARIYQYDSSQYNNELGTNRSNQAKQTEIFVSVYIPEHKYDDWARKTTKWKFFLDVAGQRYEGKVMRLKSQLAEVQSLYPFHNRWSTAYKLIFPVSTAIAETGKSKLTLTSPITSIQLSY